MDNQGRRRTPTRRDSPYPLGLQLRLQIARKSTKEQKRMNSIARENAIVTLTPAADQTGKEGYLVDVDGTEKATLIDATTDVPFGVILEGAGATGKTSIGVAAGGFKGTVRLKLGATPGTVKAGTVLQTNNDGTVKADAGSGSRVLVGQALESGAANELIEAVLFKPIVL